MFDLPILLSLEIQYCNVVQPLQNSVCSIFGLIFRQNQIVHLANHNTAACPWRRGTLYFCPKKSYEIKEN